MLKTIVIGLDGATWKILDPLIEKGHMPNLKLIIKKGSRSILDSTIPPVTGCAWLSLGTSLNPGKTGVIDFLKLDKDLSLKIVNSNDFKGRSFWDLLSKEGKRCVLLDYPMLDPPYPIKGAIISTGRGILDTYPKQLKTQIQKLVGNYDIFVGYHDEKYDDIDLFLRDLNDALDRKLEITDYLLNNLKWDIFVNVLSFTDWIQHRLWHYMDKNHPWYDEHESRKIMPKIIEFWKKIDDLIGEMLPHGDYIFIVSDHGMGSQYGCFNIAKWLETKGYLTRKRSLTRMLKPIISTFQNTWITKLLPKKIKDVGRGYASVLTEIDLNKSKTYVVGHTIPFGAIYINNQYWKYRNDNKLEEGKKLAKKSLGDSLICLNKEIGKDVKATIFYKNEIYSGEKLELLPDVIFTLNNWEVIVTKSFNNKYLYKDTPYSPRHTGSHRTEGIFLAYGPKIKNCVNINSASIYDVAPTILQIYDANIPTNIDGKVILDIFKKESKLNSFKHNEYNDRD